MNKKVLVTGGAGFIGHHVIDYLLRKTDWDLISLDRLDFSGTLSRLQEVVGQDKKYASRVRVVWHDLKAEINDFTAKEIGHVDYILHLAAGSHVDRSIENPMEFVYDNVVGTANLLEYARKKLFSLEKFLYFSTDEVFGPAPEGVFYKENDRYNSGNPYSATKAGAEELCVAYENTYKMPIMITHTMNVFGIRQHSEKYIPKIIRNVLSGEKLTIHADRTCSKPGSRHYINTEDVADSILFNKVLQWKVIGDLISTSFLMRFWRGVNKKSRLIWILETLERMFMAPLKQGWSTFKTALGYLNPWDMDRQRKKELQKKAPRKRFWKKIEPPRKPIRKKQAEIITSPTSISPPIEPKDLPGEKKKSWDGKYMNDGGTLLKKISDAKKLPPFVGRDGQVFYNISQRKFVGITLGELADQMKVPEYEVLLSLIRLLEKGLIFLLQEGKTLRDDLWDIASSLRKYDSELEKLIDSVSTLEDELEEGIDFLKTDLQNDNNNKAKKNTPLD